MLQTVTGKEVTSGPYCRQGYQERLCEEVVFQPEPEFQGGPGHASIQGKQDTGRSNPRPKPWAGEETGTLGRQEGGRGGRHSGCARVAYYGTGGAAEADSCNAGAWVSS